MEGPCRAERSPAPRGRECGTQPCQVLVHGLGAALGLPQRAREGARGGPEGARGGRGSSNALAVTLRKTVKPQRTPSCHCGLPPWEGGGARSPRGAIPGPAGGWGAARDAGQSPGAPEPRPANAQGAPWSPQGVLVRSGPTQAPQHRPPSQHVNKSQKRIESTHYPLHFMPQQTPAPNNEKFYEV